MAAGPYNNSYMFKYIIIGMFGSGLVNWKCAINLSTSFQSLYAPKINTFPRCY